MLYEVITPSDIQNIKQSLWKNYRFLNKRFGIESETVKMPAEERGMTRIAAELLSLEIVTSRQNLLFGPVPVHYDRSGSGTPEADEADEADAANDPEPAGDAESN